VTPREDSDSGAGVLVFEDFVLGVSAADTFAEDGAVRCRGPNRATPWGRLGASDEGESVFDPFLFWDDPGTGTGGVVGELAENPRRVSLDRVSELGENLANLAFPPGPIRDFFRDALIWMEGEAGGAIRLRFTIEEPQLADLPWEFITFPREGYRFLAHNRRISIVRTSVTRASRYRDREERTTIEYTGVLSPTSGPRQLNVEPDNRAVTEALAQAGGGRIHATKFGDGDEPARWDDVVAALEGGSDIFHFVGHGDFDPEAGGEGGVLIFERDGRGEDPIPAANVGPALQDADVRLAMLGACHSARPQAGNPWNGIASHLTNLGVPAVVGNQFPILDESARILATNVFKGVLSNQAIDQPVAATRASLAKLPRLGVDWGIPVVYLDNGNGVLFPGTDDSISSALGDIGARSDLETERRALAYSPYRGVAAFSRRHNHVFFGRDGLVEDVMSGLRSDGGVVAVFGPSGAGKSSLLEAGVAPQWAGPSLRVGSYLNLRDSLTESLADILGEPGGQSLAALTGYDPDGGPLLIMFDQFEDFFALGAEAAGNAVAVVEEILRRRHESTSVVFAFAQDAYSKFDEFQEHLDLEIARVVVTRLTRGQARAALQGPLTTLSPTARFEDENLVEEVLDQLDELRRREVDSIEPTELQIVAESMFLAARDRQLSPTDAIVVEQRDFPGASVIITKYLEDQIQKFFVDDAAEARQVLGEVALQRDPGWTRLPDNLTVRRLVESGFLVHRVRDEEEYAFSRDAVSQVVGRWVDPKIQEIRRARELLTGLRAGWEMTDEKTVPAVTLRGLERIAHELECSPNEAVLLLRSAVSANEDAAPWLEVVRKQAGPAVEKLEAGKGAVGLDKRLLGIPRDDAPRAGAVTTAAASSAEPTDRRTAALTLAATPEFSAPLEAAITEHNEGRTRRSRHRELWASITDADPNLQPPAPTFAQSLAINTTRAGRRVRRELEDASGDALAAGIGAGMALGLYRATMCAIECSPGILGWAPGVQFGTNLAWIGLVVLLTVLAVRLTSAIGRSGALWGAAAGAAVFGSALSAVGAIGGFSLDQYPLTVPVAFVSAVPIAVGLALKRTGYRYIVAATVAVALVWSGGQLLLATKGGEACDFTNCERAASLPVVESAWFFADDKSDVTDWDIGLSALDAAMAGGLVFAGSIAGGYARRKIKGPPRIPH